MAAMMRRLLTSKKALVGLVALTLGLALIYLYQTSTDQAFNLPFTAVAPPKVAGFIFECPLSL